MHQLKQCLLIWEKRENYEANANMSTASSFGRSYVILLLGGVANKKVTI